MDVALPWVTTANRKKPFRQRKIIFILLGCLAALTLIWNFFLVSSSPFLSSTPQELLKALEERSLRTHLEYLSSDLFEGRGTGTRGESLAVSYIQTQMSLAGLETVQQEVPLVGLLPEYENPFALKFSDSKGSKPLELAYKDDFVLATDSAAQQVISSTGEIVFVGFGINAPEYGWNDYQAVNVQGKVLMAFVNEPMPTHAEPLLFKGQELTYYDGCTKWKRQEGEELEH